MDPGKRPSNDNKGGQAEWEPGLFSTRKRAIESTFSLCGIVGLVTFALYVLDAARWKSVGITLAIAFLVALVAAIYRRIVYGRA